jgi:hypothetical protein
VEGRAGRLKMTEGQMTAGLVMLGASQFALGLWQAFAPASFFTSIATYGPQNEHYVRDVSTLYLALGVALLVAARRPSWRLPVLAFAALQYALHSINHLLDVGAADPAWIGPANLLSVVVVGLVFGYFALAARQPQAARSPNRSSTR